VLPRERVVAQLQHRASDVVPYVVPVEEEVAERLDAHYGGRQWRQRKRDHIVRVMGLTVTQEPTGEPAHVRDAYGSIWRTDLRPMHLVRPALAEPDMAGYTFPDPEQLVPEEAIEQARQECGRLHKEGFFVMSVLSWGLFERSWILRGFENALMDMIVNRSFYEELLDAITEHYLAALDRLLAVPVDAIQTGDDWGDQRGVIMGKRRWMEMFYPRYIRLWEKIKQAGRFTIHHSCGNISELVGELPGAGLDCLESVQPEAMDPYRLKEQFGDRIAFWGGLGTQRLLPYGTPREIRDEVNRLCRRMGAGGGYILAPAKPVMPEVPTENAVALLEAVLAEAGESI